MSAANGQTMTPSVLRSPAALIATAGLTSPAASCSGWSGTRPPNSVPPRPRRWARPRTVRAATAIIAAAGIGVSVAACTSSSGAPGVANAESASVGESSSPSGSAASDPVAFSQCMRSHGITNFPDPDSRGAIPKTDPQHLGVSQSRYDAARRACQHLLPNNGGLTQRQVQQVLTLMGNTARCMRAHGAPDWPDPTTDSQGRFVFNLLHVHDFDPNSQQIQTELQQECHFVLPPWAVGHVGLESP